MVTTRITEAVPMTIPRPVRMERMGLARKACALKRTASPKNMEQGLGAPHLAQEFFGLRSRRIVRGEGHAQVTLQQIFGLVQIAIVLDVKIRLRKNDPGTVGNDFIGAGQALLRFLEAALPREQSGQIDNTADLSG